MHHKITKDGLLLIADLEDLQELTDLKDNDDFGSEYTMHEILEDFVCNSEFSWILPEDIGALTDAPILGIVDNNDNSTVIEAFGFMDYQVISLQEQLLQYGSALLIAG